MAKKYIFVNGVMTLNPEWQKENPSTVPTPPAAAASATPPLAVVTSLEDIKDAQAVQGASGVKMEIPESTQEAMMSVQDEEFLKKFNSPEEIEGGDLLEKISAVFSAYEIPFGLLKKLLALKDYDMNFILDDSGSMGNATDSNVNQASGYMKNYLSKLGGDPTRPMTRWQEAEDRLHIMIDMIAYVPTGAIHVGFLNRSNKLELKRDGKTPEEFMMDAHEQIRAIFAHGPAGSTPVGKVLQKTFNPHPKVKTMHYLFTDGVPDEGTAAVARLVSDRKYPEFHPLTMISCSNVDSEVEWMKEVEEKAPFVTEVDDYSDEGDEVHHDQGARFPYPRGLWLMTQLVGAINPFDLDALDDETPLSKFTMDELFGREHTAQEYDEYWKNHPKAVNFAKYKDQFSTKPLHGSQIVDPKGATEKIKSLTSRMAGLFS